MVEDRLSEWGSDTGSARLVRNGERYWEFNSARQQSFRARNRAIAENVPAASALGTRSGNPLVIYFLASPGAAKPIENPRQVSAFDYPARYGPHSPTFSRATLLDQHLGFPLLVSGTDTDDAGALFRLLEPLALHRVNMTRIESRPSRKRKWDYVFFIDVEGHVSDPPVAKALAALEERASLFKVLGSYPRAVL